MLPSSELRKVFRMMLLILTCCGFAGLAAAQTDDWVGTAGSWSDSTQWNNGVPTNGENIVIGTASANSTDDFSLAIGTLTLSDSADTLNIADGVALNVSSGINNSGAINLASAGSNTSLLITGNVSLTGTGSLVLGSAGPNYIQGASGTGTEILTNSSTISGVGNIGNGLMGLVNSGTILSNASAANLFIDVSSAGFNTPGTVEAETGGNLTIEGPANSFSNYNAKTNILTGGTYTANAGNIYFAGTAKGVTVLSAKATQEAGGQIINSTTGTNAFANLATITATGVLTTQVGFTQPGVFSMAGALNILPNTVVNVGSVKQIVNNALTGGQWVLDSNLNITGNPASIETNSATMTLSGGTFMNTADGSNAFASLTANKKSLRVLNFAKFTTNGSLANTGQMTVAKGCKLTIGGTGTSYSQSTGKTTMDGMLTGGVSISGGTYLGAGSVTGNFSLGGGTSNATFSVGDAGKAAQVKVTGNYSQTTNGILSTPIGGTTVATQYSQVKATGSATLGGTLTAPLILNFTPTAGQTFTVLSAKSVAGAFSNTTIAINSSEFFTISYTVNSVVLTVTASGAVE
jgi:fibronectin-binding autotransporter adhesin